MTSRPPLAERLDLAPHPEGGWFRETWRSAVVFSPAGWQSHGHACLAPWFAPRRQPPSNSIGPYSIWALLPERPRRLRNPRTT
jgi:hypothetical protein